MSRAVIVVGGGASGLAAAVSAAKAGADVLLLERLSRVGKKILLTGNGRCNLAHAGFDWQHYHGTLPQARGILEKFDAASYFSHLGLYIRTDGEGRQYPCSGTAASVLDALRFAAERSGVRMQCDCKVTGLRQHKTGWRVICGEAKYDADAVILAAGGSAAPNCGTDGSLLPLLREMGYRIAPPKPSLCPIPTDPQRVRALKGMRVRAAVRAIHRAEVCKTETGELQFTENALSGICIFNLSRYAAMYGKQMTVSVDLLPDLSEAESAQILENLLSVRGDLPCGELLTGLLPKRVGEQCMKQMFGTASEPAQAVLRGSEQKRSLLHLLHGWEFPVTGQASFQQAQVTAGGIAGACVSRNLESKLHPSLYFCGELLDIDGDCGGYNLAWAWASGIAAGAAAAQPSCAETK